MVIATVVRVHLKRVVACFGCIVSVDLDEVGACRQVAADSEIVVFRAIATLVDRPAVLPVQDAAGVHAAGSAQL